MTVTYYARIDYIYDGGDKNFSIPFDYIKEEHVKAIINDSDILINDLEFLTTNQVHLDVDLNVGDKVSILRVTPLDERIVVFEDNNILDEETQNLSAVQVFDAVQEVTDRQTRLEIDLTALVISILNNAVHDIEVAQDVMEEAIQTYVNQQFINAKADLASQFYTQSESDNLFATIENVTALSNAYDLTLDAINAALEEILYGSSRGARLAAIGVPILTFDDTLGDDEVWLEGGELPISGYSVLYAKYGDKFGQASQSGYFKLPDFRNRVLQGTIENNYGYLEAGLPNITGHIYRVAGQVNSSIGADGGFTSQYTGNDHYEASDSHSLPNSTITFDASRSNSIYGNSSTVQPPAIKVRVKTKWK